MSKKKENSSIQSSLVPSHSSNTSETLPKGLRSRVQGPGIQEHEKNKTFIILEIIEYIPNSVVIKTIIKKTTGNVTVSSFDSGEA